MTAYRFTRCLLIVAFARSGLGQTPGRADPFLIIDRIREPIPSFVDSSSPLARLASPLSGSISAAGGLTARSSEDLEPRTDGLGIIRAHASPSFAHVINWDVAGAASLMGHGLGAGFIQPSISFGSNPSPVSQLVFYGGASTTNEPARDVSIGLQKAAWAGASWTTPGWSPPAPSLRLRAIISLQADWRANDDARPQPRKEPRPHYSISVPLLFNKLGIPGILYSYERRAAFDDLPLDENDLSLLYDPKIVDAAKHHFWNDRRSPELIAQFATMRHAGRRIEELRILLATTLLP